ncbi:hypothetical protein [Acidithiobacillus sp.]|uniref:hypothetical protein n=1 Tax=Acidithiobacillus sp. TaxID=1872118 RepID=UPI0025855540|nr:hypothetical protein [Acidithiobacillus sp.]MDD5375617.1 hypothetical protein [Acidithiobacillus sp.]
MLTPSLFNGMPYAGESTVIPLKMHLYIQALAFVQGMTLRAVHEDGASRFLAEKAWEKGLRWRDGHPPAVSGPEWVEVHVRIPAHLADNLAEVSRRNGVGLPDALYTMLYWYSWILYPPLQEQERRKTKFRASKAREERERCHRSLP